MQPIQHFRRFVGHHPLLGSVLWLSTIQFFITQIIVAFAWSNPPYSWDRMTISELGATICGQVDGRYMCSPMHSLMNGSFVVLGLAMFIGSVLLYLKLRRSRAGFTLMAIAGAGAMMVGFVPMDTIYWLHIVGADTAFLLGNIALIVFGLTLGLPNWFKWYSIVSGIIALLGLVLFFTHTHFLLGLGGMERVVAYPMVAWMFVFAVYSMRNQTQGSVK